jgi:oligoribonuclease NrnB/cAMP/cGMP phosphodiesterase (DHH superfamily)
MSTEHPVCFYHVADLDGKCSGAIVNKALKGDVELYGYDYGWPFPWGKVFGRDVIMVDVSLQPASDMLKLASEAKSFTWIDHHKSAIEEADKLGLQADGVRKVGLAACELCWRYYFPDSRMPLAVELLGRYDVWDHSNPDALPFQYGARLKLPDACHTYWSEVLVSVGACAVDPIISDGRLILAYETEQNRKRAGALAFETQIDGLRAIAANVGLTNSQLFDSVWDPERHDVMMPFYRSKKGYWTVSIYSTKPEIDCSVVAKAHGGGGHKGAAGFQCAELPFSLTAE